MENVVHEVWVKDALVFLFAAGILIPLLRLLTIPPVLGFLVAGIGLGPFGIGALTPDIPILSYVSISDPEAARPFAELGVLFLLFMLGLELSFARLWALRRMVFGGGTLQAFASAAILASGIWLVGGDPAVSITAGLALALSSTAIVMQLLTDQHRVAQPIGRSALAILLFQDLLVAPILIVVGFLGRDTEAGLLSIVARAVIEGFIAVAVIVVAGRFVLKRAFRLAARAGGRDLLMAITLLAVIGGALLTAGAGLSLPLGAFLAGLLLGETEFKHQAEVDLEPFKGLLLGIFFMTVGMGLNLGEVWDKIWVVTIGLVSLLAVKWIVAWSSCYLFSQSRPVSLEAAFLLAPAGEFAFVVVQAATLAGVMDWATGSLLSAIAGLSMLCAPLLAGLGRRLAAKFTPAAEPVDRLDHADLSGHVILAGFGRVGQMVARILTVEEADLLALERDSEVVKRLKVGGMRLYVGDASRQEILVSAGILNAAMLVVAVDGPADAERLVRAAREIRSDLTILVRARDSAHAEILLAAGANFVIADAIEAGLQLAGRALQEYGYAVDTISDRIDREREGEYRREADMPAR